MDISERVLFSELAQLLKKEATQKTKTSSYNKPKANFSSNNADPNEPPPEYFYEQEQAAMGLVKGGEVPSNKIDQISILEQEIIRILVLYGNEHIDFKEDVVNVDEEGRERVTTRTYNHSVSTEIYLHLQDDEIEFSNSIFQEIYTEMINQLNQLEKLEINVFTHHKNPEITNLITGILMDNENPNKQLSNWEEKNIEVKKAVEVLNKAVPDVIYNLRRILIDKKIEELMKEATENQSVAIDLEIIKNYTSLKMRLFEKLNRVV
jgi:DNA primase